jgi:hypothetical protein
MNPPIDRKNQFMMLAKKMGLDIPLSFKYGPLKF